MKTIVTAVGNVLEENVIVIENGAELIVPSLEKCVQKSVWMEEPVLIEVGMVLVKFYQLRGVDASKMALLANQITI